MEWSEAEEEAVTKGRAAAGRGAAGTARDSGKKRRREAEEEENERKMLGWREERREAERVVGVINERAEERRVAEVKRSWESLTAMRNVMVRHGYRGGRGEIRGGSPRQRREWVTGRKWAAPMRNVESNMKIMGQ